MNGWNVTDGERAGTPWRPFLTAMALVVALVVGGFGALSLGGGLAFAQDAGTGTTTTQTEEALSVADVAERANPAVVTITTLGDIGGVFGGGDEALPIGTGSGFIIDAEGHIVTNYHVVEDADEFTILFFDGDTATATLVGGDATQDIAVLQLDLEEGETVPGTLAFGDTESVRAGDQVVSIGSALGEFTNTVTEGTVGAVDRALSESPNRTLPNLVQHDAPIWPGNSGGPLLNLQGEVIGVNVAGIGGTRLEATPAQLALAIEASAAEQVVEELLATGEVVRPYLGILGAAINEGHEVAEVLEDGPAEAAGIEAEDVITAIEDQAIDGPNGLNDALWQYDPGDVVSVTLERDGGTETVEVTLDERPALAE